MRHRKANLRARVNGDLALRFTAEGLTSHSGLEIFRLYLRRRDFAARLRRRLKAVDPGADYSSVDLIRVFIAMLIVGARRLSHVRYLGSDPVVQRFVELRTLPSDRTLARWLSRCKASVRSVLLAFMMELIGDSLRPLQLRRLTIDIDGTVLSTGLQVERAFRGYNPHRRKVPSYYPITAYLAQTGHLLSVRNRSGNVHDGKASMSFFRDLFADIRAIEPKALSRYGSMEPSSAVKSSPGWSPAPSTRFVCPSTNGSTSRVSWLVAGGGRGLHQVSMDSSRRVRLAPWKRDVQVASLPEEGATPDSQELPARSLRSEQRILGILGHHNQQADRPSSTLALLGGRGTHEKVLGQLKTGFAFNAIPTTQLRCQQHLASAVRHLPTTSITSFQIATSAPRRQPSRKRTALFFLKSIHTLRYEFLNKAGIVQRPNGRPTLTLSNNRATKEMLQRLVDKLDRAA